MLGAATNVRQVNARTRTTLEDGAFFFVPIQDRIHRVVNSQDETCTGLLRYTVDADVEPHR